MREHNVMGDIYFTSETLEFELNTLNTHLCIIENKKLSYVYSLHDISIACHDKSLKITQQHRIKLTNDQFDNLLKTIGI